MVSSLLRLARLVHRLLHRGVPVTAVAIQGSDVHWEHVWAPWAQRQQVHPCFSDRPVASAQVQVRHRDFNIAAHTRSCQLARQAPHQCVVQACLLACLALHHVPPRRRSVCCVLCAVCCVLCAVRYVMCALCCVLHAVYCVKNPCVSYQKSCANEKPTLVGLPAHHRSHMKKRFGGVFGAPTNADEKTHGKILKKSMAEMKK